MDINIIHNRFFLLFTIKRKRYCSSTSLATEGAVLNHVFQHQLRHNCRECLCALKSLTALLYRLSF